jgi:hypothetical protein
VDGSGKIAARKVFQIRAAISTGFPQAAVDAFSQRLRQKRGVLHKFTGPITTTGFK